MDARFQRRRRGLFWLLVLLVVILVWFLWRPTPGGRNEEHARNDASQGDPDDILVDLRDDATSAAVAAVENRLGIDLILLSKEAAGEQLYRAHVEASRRDEIIERLGRMPEVEVAEPDAEYGVPPLPAAEQTMWQEQIPPGRRRGPTPNSNDEDSWHGYPNDPQFKYQWHLRQIDMPRAWKLAGGDDVVVAVIDTGVAYEDHGRFRRASDLASTRFVAGYNFVSDNEHANDDHGHGTHVAGTIAQSTHNGIGVAGIGRNVAIMPLKVLSAGGSGSVGAIADAVHFAVDHGAKVINMSLGGRFGSRILERAVKYAHRKGVVVVCAAGNDGRGKVSYPAAYPGAIGVAATQYDESTTFYSNWGKGIDIAAPGGNTRVDQDNDGRPDGVLQNTIYPGDPTRDDYFAFMGTSMASPHVAGVAALLVGEGINDPSALESYLERSARHPRGRDHDRARYGAGIVDASAALRLARGTLGVWQLVFGLCLAMAVAGFRRGGIDGKYCPRLGATYLAGIVAGASGLFVVPFLGSPGAALSSWPILSLFSRGFPSWDLPLLGANAHGNPVFFSALVPLLLVIALHGWRRLRAPLAGFAAGVAGHLLLCLLAGNCDIRWIPGSGLLDGTWLLANILGCVGLAHLVAHRDE
ncbi:MAG: S8 family serine peptidase [Pseudomonadota bacterium]